MNEIVNQPFVAPTFEKFLNHKQIEDIADHAWLKETWDFNLSLGDTIKEKYESLYCKVVELNNKLVKSGAKGYFWIVTSPEIASIFETCTWGYNPIGCREFEEKNAIKHIGGVVPQGLAYIEYCGTLYSKWRLYKDSQLTEQIIVGCNDVMQPYTNYACLTIENFIF